MYGVDVGYLTQRFCLMFNSLCNKLLCVQVL